MIINGLSITVIGMGIVFAFLVILVLTMIFLNFILRKFFPKTLEHKVEKRKAGEYSASDIGAQKDELAVVAAAVAAIHAHIAVSRG